MSEGNDLQARWWLVDGEVDISLVVTPTEGLETVELACDELVVVLPAGHTLASRATVPLGALAHEPLVLSTGGCAALVRSTFQRHRLDIEPAHVSPEGATAIAMVEAGLGLTLMPLMGVPPLPPTLLTRQVNPTSQRTLGLGWRPRETLSSAADAFVGLARSQASRETLSLMHQAG